MAEIINVTKEQFMAFERVRESGVCNMLDAAVQQLCGFNRDIHKAIISQYNELVQKYPEVRNND